MRTHNAQKYHIYNHQIQISTIRFMWGLPMILVGNMVEKMIKISQIFFLRKKEYKTRSRNPVSSKTSSQNRFSLKNCKTWKFHFLPKWHQQYPFWGPVLGENPRESWVRPRSCFDFLFFYKTYLFGPMRPRSVIWGVADAPCEYLSDNSKLVLQPQNYWGIY